MNLLSLENVAKSMGGRLLFSGVSLGVESGDRIGFVAPNGSGKTTFLKLLAREEQPDEGRISRKKDLRVSVLPQTTNCPGDFTVRDYLFSMPNPLLDLVRRYEDSTDMADPELYSSLLEEMEHRDAWALEGRIRTVLSMLGISDQKALMRELSGGMRRRVALAGALLGDAELIILDEPTNHLDMQTIIKLQDYLLGLEAALLVVTHDRYFLEEVCNRIWEIESEEVFSYPGDYSAYLHGRAVRFEQRQRQQERTLTVLRKEEAWFRQGPKARTGRDRKRLAGLEELREASVGEEQHIQAGFASSSRRLGKKILSVNRIAKSYNGKKVIADFSYEFTAGDRIAVIGRNGSGKTSLLNMLDGTIPPDTGMIDCGVNTHFAHFRQDFPAVNEDLEVLEYLYRIASVYKNPEGGQLTPETLLDRFGFPRALHRTAVKNISGGERRRLYLVSLLLEAPNFLLMDEPGNDLDIDTLRMLEEFLLGFEGCIILVSHDRALVDRIADRLLIVQQDGTVRDFGGSCSEYIEWSNSEDERIRKENRETAGNSGEVRRRQNLRKISYSERKEYEAIEGEIADMENEIALLERNFSAGCNDPEKLRRDHLRYSELQQNLEKKYSRWEELAVLLE